MTQMTWNNATMAPKWVPTSESVFGMADNVTGQQWNEPTQSLNWTTYTTDIMFETFTSRPVYLPHPKSLQKRVAEARTIICYILLVVGLIGNSLAFVVMCRKSMRRTSTSVYFRAIALADSLFLATSQGSYIVKVITGKSLRQYNPWSCKIHIVMTYMSGDIAIWLLIAVTIDRFVAIVLPLKAKNVCTPCKAIYACTVVSVLAFAKSARMFWTKGEYVYKRSDGSLDVNICGNTSPSYQNFEKTIQPWINVTFVTLIPTLMIFTLNITIIDTLWKMKRKVGMFSVNPQNMPCKKEKDRREMTLVFLSVSIAFLVLIPPTFIVSAFDDYMGLTSSQRSILQQISAILLFTNHSCNFFLYCLTGKGFRREVKKIVCYWKMKHQQEDSYLLTGTQSGRIKSQSVSVNTTECRA